MKIDYDHEGKIMTLRFTSSTSVDSEIHGNVVLDYDSSGDLVKIDVMDFNLEELAIGDSVTAIRQ